MLPMIVTEILPDDLRERHHGDTLDGPLLSDREECHHPDSPGAECSCDSFQECPDFSDGTKAT